MTVQKTLYIPLDTRRNISSMDPHEPFTKRLQEQAESVACLIHKDDLTLTAEGKKYKLRSDPPTHDQELRARFGVPLSDQEKFGDEPVIGKATAFLVSNRLAITAAHCVCLPNSQILREDFKSTVLVFGVKITEKPTEFPRKRVYQISRVIAHEYSTLFQKDWALVELDRDVEGLKPLALDFEAQRVTKLAIYMLGHPSGLPLKYSGEGVITQWEPYTFKAFISAFQGNSGSPIISKASNKVIGICSKGSDDFDLNSRPGYVSLYYAKKGDRETCQTMTTNIQDALLNYHLQLRMGLNLTTPCPNSECHAFQKVLVVRRYAGTFNLGKEGCKAFLPCCGKRVQHVTSMTLYKCRYSYEGADQNGDKHQEGFQSINHRALDLTPLFDNWEYCEITVKHQR